MEGRGVAPPQFEAVDDERPALPPDLDFGTILKMAPPGTSLRGVAKAFVGFVLEAPQEEVETTIRGAVDDPQRVEELLAWVRELRALKAKSR